MKISQHWKNSPENTYNKTEISNKFGFFFAKHLPEFFKGGVSLKQIRTAMPVSLFNEYCKELNIEYHNDLFIQKIKDPEKISQEYFDVDDAQRFGKEVEHEDF